MESFPVTQWSLVDRARQTDDDRRRAALSVLLKRYLPALRAHLVIAKRVSSHAADDLLQGFVADKIIEQNLLEHARQEKGKFRSFLLVTLNHYVISQHRAASATTRAPAGGMAPLNEQVDQITAGEDPAEQYNLAWARELLDEALLRMKRECETSNRMDLWTILDERVLGPTLHGTEPLPYEQLVNQLKLETPLQACALLTTAKRMFARNLRAVAADYAETEQGAEAELDDLRQILSRGGAESSKPPRS